MNHEYLRGLISATSEDEARRILRELLNGHLVAGGHITHGPSDFWWQGKIDEELYYNISVFTTSRHKVKIIEIVEKLSKDDTPVITFYKIDDASKKTLLWIDEKTKTKGTVLFFPRL